MDDAVTKALKRKRELQAELAEIEQFLKVHRRFSGRPVAAYRENLSDDADPMLDIVREPLSPIAEVMLRAGQPSTIRQRGRPADFADLAARIIGEVGQPMSRSALVKEMESRGVAIPSADRERYIGTILWRHRGRFINFENIGYWLRSLPFEPMQYQPEDYDDQAPNWRDEEGLDFDE